MIITSLYDNKSIDIKKLSKIVLKQMEFIGSSHNYEKINTIIENTLKNDKALFFIKINENKEYVGFVFGNIGSGLESGAEYLWINELYVEKEYRRKNIATEIFNFVEKWAKENGIKYIATMTSKMNKGAIKFYKNIGYKLSDIKWVDKNIE